MNGIVFAQTLGRPIVTVIVMGAVLRKITIEFYVRFFSSTVFYTNIFMHRAT